MNKRKELIEMLRRAIGRAESLSGMLGTRKYVTLLQSEAADLLRELEGDCKEEYRVQSIASYFSKKTPFPTTWSNDILDYILNRSKHLPKPPKTEK